MARSYAKGENKVDKTDESAPREPPKDDYLADVADFFASVGNGDVISIERTSPIHIRGWLTNIPWQAGLDIEEEIQRSYGGGSYLLRFKRKSRDGRWNFSTGSTSVTIAGHPKDATTTSLAVQTQTALAAIGHSNSEDMQKRLFDLLQSQLGAKNDELPGLVAKIVETVSGRATQAVQDPLQQLLLSAETGKKLAAMFSGDRISNPSDDDDGDDETGVDTSNMSAMDKMMMVVMAKIMGSGDQKAAQAPMGGPPDRLPPPPPPYIAPPGQEWLWSHQRGWILFPLRGDRAQEQEFHRRQQEERRANDLRMRNDDPAASSRRIVPNPPQSGRVEGNGNVPKNGSGTIGIVAGKGISFSKSPTGEHVPPVQGAPKCIACRGRGILTKDDGGDAICGFCKGDGIEREHPQFASHTPGQWKPMSEGFDGQPEVLAQVMRARPDELEVCERCSGFGRLQVANGLMLTCSVCKGVGGLHPSFSSVDANGHNGGAKPDELLGAPRIENPGRPDSIEFPCPYCRVGRADMNLEDALECKSCGERFFVDEVGNPGKRCVDCDGEGVLVDEDNGDLDNMCKRCDGGGMEPDDEEEDARTPEEIAEEIEEMPIDEKRRLFAILAPGLGLDPEMVAAFVTESVKGGEGGN
jgi:DnaJ-class molecular chaperone